jgi:hypothetical protein
LSYAGDKPVLAVPVPIRGAALRTIRAECHTGVDTGVEFAAPKKFLSHWVHFFAEAEGGGLRA